MVKFQHSSGTAGELHVEPLLNNLKIIILQ